MGNWTLDVELDLPATPTQGNTGYTAKARLAASSQARAADLSPDSLVRAAIVAPGVIDAGAYPAGLFGPLSKASLLDAEFLLQTAPPLLRVSGNLAVFSDRTPLSAELVVMRPDSPPAASWGFGFAVAVGEKLDWVGHLAPALRSLVSYAFMDGVLAMSSLPAGTSVQFPNLLARNVAVAGPGVELAAQMGLHGKGLDTVRKWTGINGVDVTGTYRTDTTDLVLSGDVLGTWNLGTPRVRLTEAQLSVSAKLGSDAPLPTASLAGFMSVDVGSRPALSTLKLRGSISLDPAAVTLDAALLNDWSEPFGVARLTLERAEASIGFNVETGVPIRGGLSGGFRWGKSLAGDATVLFDAASGDGIVAAYLSEFSLDDIVQSICGECAVPSWLAHSVLELSFDGADLEVNPGAAAQTFNGRTFAPGVYFKVQRFDLFGLLRGSALVQASQDKSIDVTLAVNETRIADVVVISGASGTGPFKLDIALLDQPASSVDHVVFDCGVDVINVLNLAAKGAFTDASFNIDARLTLEHQDDPHGLVDFQLSLDLQGTLSSPKDWSLDANLNNALLDFLSVNVSDSLAILSSHFDARMADAEAGVKEWEQDEKPKISENNQKIVAIQGADSREFSAAQAKLRDAEIDLARKVSSLQSISDRIASDESQKQHCSHWYSISCHAHNGWLDAKIAADEVEKATATVALRAAQDAVALASKVVSDAGEVAHHADPRVLALEAESAAIKAAGIGAENALAAATAMVNDMSDVAQWLLHESGRVLNIRTAKIQAASLKDTASSGVISYAFSGTFLGKNEALSGSVAFPPKPKELQRLVLDHFLKGRGSFRMA